MDTDRFWISFDPDNVADPDAAMAAWRDLMRLEPYEHLNAKALKEAIVQALKEPDKHDHKFAPRFLNNVYVISNQFDDDDSYRAFYEKHVSTKNNKRVMVRRCTGEEIVMQMIEDAWGLYDHSRKACPRVIAEANGQDPNKACDCKLNGRLRLIIPALLDAASLPHGYFELQTQAWRDDANIYAALSYHQQNWGDPYGVPLSQIPFLLWRERVDYSYAGSDGQVQPKTEYVIRMKATDEYMTTKRSVRPTVLVKQAPVLESDEYDPDPSTEDVDWPDEGAMDASTSAPDEHGVVSEDTGLPANALDLMQQLQEKAVRYLGFTADELLEWLALADYGDLLREYPTWTDICKAVTDLLVEEELPVRVYGTRTEEYGPSNVRHLLPYGFGSVYIYSRDAFNGIEGYDKDTDYDHTNDAGKVVKRNVSFLGDHYFNEVFGREYVLLTLARNGNGNLEATAIYDPAKTMPL